MSAKTAQGELAGLIAELKKIADTAQRIFGGLNAIQLNWTPNAGEWSIAQCFEHLILVNADYFPLLQRIACGEWKPTLKERVPLLPKLFGKVVLNAMQPDAKRKVKAIPRFQPSGSAIDRDIINRFVAHQQELCRHMQATADCDWHKTIITSPVASLLTYSVFDAYRIIVAHEQQHVALGGARLSRRAVPASGHSGHSGQQTLMPSSPWSSSGMICSRTSRPPPRCTSRASAGSRRSSSCTSSPCSCTR